MEMILTGRIAIRINDDINDNADVKEAFKNGEFSVKVLELSMVDENGENLMPENESVDNINNIIHEALLAKL